MLWPDERIEKYTDGYRVVATDDDDADCKWWQSQMFLAMQEVRDEYEASIAELEGKVALLISSLKRSGASYAELVDRSDAVFRENCELIGRIAELESGGE